MNHSGCGGCGRCEVCQATEEWIDRVIKTYVLGYPHGASDLEQSGGVGEGAI